MERIFYIVGLGLYNKIEKLRNNILIKKYNFPKDTDIAISSKLRNCSLEGKNKISKNVFVRDSRIGFGTFVAPGSKIIGCEIGRYCAVGFEALIGGHPIHNTVSINPAFYSTQGQYGYTYVERDSYQEYRYVDKENGTFIKIGNDVWVTSGATKIYQNISIGDGAVVMVNAVVTKNVPPYAIVAGVPAKIIGYRFNEREIEFLLKLKWWNREEKWIETHANYFADIKQLMNVVACEEPEQFGEYYEA